MEAHTLCTWVTVVLLGFWWGSQQWVHDLSLMDRPGPIPYTEVSCTALLQRGGALSCFSLICHSLLIPEGDLTTSELGRRSGWEEDARRKVVGREQEKRREGNLCLVCKIKGKNLSPQPYLWAIMSSFSFFLLVLITQLLRLAKPKNTFRQEHKALVWSHS